MEPGGNQTSPAEGAIRSCRSKYAIKSAEGSTGGQELQGNWKPPGATEPLEPHKDRLEHWEPRWWSQNCARCQRAQKLQNNWEPVGHQYCRGSHQELWNPWSHQGSAGALGATRRTSGATKLREPGGIPVVLQNHTREPQSSMGCTALSCQGASMEPQSTGSQQTHQKSGERGASFHHGSHQRAAGAM